MKNKDERVEEIFNDYDKAKHKHLEKLATKMLKDQDKIDKLKEKKINKDFLKLF